MTMLKLNDDGQDSKRYAHFFSAVYMFPNDKPDRKSCKFGI